jgi:hypothetical protein
MQEAASLQYQVLQQTVLSSSQSVLVRAIQPHGLDSACALSRRVAAVRTGVIEVGVDNETRWPIDNLAIVNRIQQKSFLKNSDSVQGSPCNMLQSEPRKLH